MVQFFLIFVVALLFSILGTPLARRLALATGIVDMPSQRKVHHEPTPLLGGAAIYGSFVVALLLLGGRAEVRQMISIVLGATSISLVGLVDDARGVSPMLKLVAQFCAAAIVVISGLRVHIFPWEALNIGVSLLWIVAITNALNLLDNMNGLSGGIAAIAAAHFLLLAALNGQYLVGVLSAALLGACIGFLRYNFNPASIFMGDTGALFIGFILASVAIKLRFTNTFVVTWMVPPVVLLLPIFDTTLVFISRLRRGLNPLTTPGKDHLSHRLVTFGFSRREAVLICWLIASSAGMFAVFLTQAPVLGAYGMAALLIAGSLYAIWQLERRFVAQ
jgi:UDP-GlcNAc:undecaprenyl-phosphate GlcNAc-1-phosphate transferase